jgi:hypothetical protein
MTMNCADCKKFASCEKNTESWKKARSLYPDRLFRSAIIKQMEYMRKVFEECKEKIL